FPLPRGAENGRAVKNEMEKLAGINGASLASSGHRSRSSVSSNGVRMISADEDYLEVYRLDLLAGRNYQVSDSSREALVNEAQIRKMGIVDPHEALGEKVDTDKVIIGVVRDFYVGSLYHDIQPTAIIPNKVNFINLSIRLSGNDIGPTLDRLERAWQTFYPNEPFEYYFLDQSIAAYYGQEQRVSKIMFIFTLVALVIGAIGLYGLVTFVMHRRLREIGVRKVLGATFMQIVQTVSREFLLLLGLAFLVSAPLGWYLSEIWLSDYINRIELSPLIFVLAVISSLAIALLAVIQKSFAAARVNPVEILRRE
ncbi:MAG: FtsX-like permease family protein, partial [Bacteroidota bacterium]